MFLIVLATNVYQIAVYNANIDVILVRILGNQSIGINNFPLLLLTYVIILILGNSLKAMNENVR